MHWAEIFTLSWNLCIELKLLQCVTSLCIESSAHFSGCRTKVLQFRPSWRQKLGHILKDVISSSRNVCFLFPRMLWLKSLFCYLSGVPCCQIWKTRFDRSLFCLGISTYLTSLLRLAVFPGPQHPPHHTAFDELFSEYDWIGWSFD